MFLHNRDMSQSIGHDLEADPRKIELYTAVMEMIAKMEGTQLDKK